MAPSEGASYSSFMLTAILLGVVAASPFHLVIDPGHDPEHPGAISARGIPEVQFNDRISAALSKALQSVLPAAELQVTVSRRPDEKLAIKARGRRLNQLRPDLVISLHHDSVQPHLLKSWTHDGKKLRYCDDHAGYSLLVPTRGYYAGMAQLAAQDMAAELLAAKRAFTTYHALDIPGERVPWVNEKLGIYAGDYLYLLREVQAPIVLVELGFIINRDDEERLSSPEEVELLAGVLARAVQSYLHRRVAPEPRGHGGLQQQLLRGGERPAGDSHPHPR